MDRITANIFNIQPMSTEDGPGIRSTVFMKGCNMRCLWCQNPEGLTPRTHLVHDARRCIGCGSCLKSCPRGAITDSGSGFKFNTNCERCLACANCCPSRAIRVIGESITVDQLMQTLLRDKHFYDQSSGGVTFSGGECLLQSQFLLEIIPRLQEKGIHICIDTAGCIRPEVFKPVAALADLILYDLKVIDDSLHRRLTGVSNKLILENAVWLGGAGIPVWIRVPVVPGYTASEENMTEIASFLSSTMPGVERVDLLGFNDLCSNDYAMLDMEFPLLNAARVKEQAMLRLKEILSLSGAGVVSISNYLKEV